MRCDIIADGIVAAAKEVNLSVPLVVRLEGTNVEKGKEILEASGLHIVSADNLGDAAQKIVGKVKLAAGTRSEEHTSELQTLMSSSYAVTSRKKKKNKKTTRKKEKKK